MKALILTILTLLSAESFASQCESLFKEDLQVALETKVFFRATTKSVEDIKPDTRELLIDEKVEVGDLVYIEFQEPIIRHKSTTTSSVEGHMLGTKMMIDPTTNEAQLFYFVLDTSNKKFDVVIGFKEENIDYEESRVLKRENYLRQTIN